MFHTWFFLKRLAESLDDHLKGMELLAVFSQQKDELILSFAASGKEWHLRADLHRERSVLSLRDDFARARKNSVDLFQEVIGQRVEHVFCFMQERSFAIEFSGNVSLIFKMHGSRSNVLLASDDQVKEVFRNNLQGDHQIIPSKLHNYAPLDGHMFLRLLGKANRWLIDESQSLDVLVEAVKNNALFIRMQDERPILSLWPLEGAGFETQDPIEACNKYADLVYRYTTVYKERETLLALLRKQFHQTENYILKARQKRNEVVRSRDLQELGHLIMANLHNLKLGDRKAVVEDFYFGGQVEIKLNPKLSPQKNAEQYYRKAKNKKIEVDVLDKNIQQKISRLENLREKLREVQSLDDIKKIRKYRSIFVDQQREEVAEDQPYHLYTFEDWIIMVGKNARANDVLTQRIARKNDLWLHARDVPGSHVVVRERPGHNYSGVVIEKAAALAAWFSKRKNDSLCPVIYTPRKYIRKVKGAAPGQVMVDREEVILIEPSNRI